MTVRDELADFLRRRRLALSPEVVGLPAGQRRRTPGLRRHEVALLANMSTNYYERLEQGRGPQPSPAILSALASALRLDPAERDYLHRLVGYALPATPRPDDFVDPGLLSVMRALAPTSPAFIADDISSIVVQNELHVALFGRLAGLPGWEGNLVWRWFTSRRRRFNLGLPGQHEDMSQTCVAILRTVIAERNHDAAALALVADLRAVSAEFCRIWDEHRVCEPRFSTLTAIDDRVGRLDFGGNVVMSPRSRQRLLILEAIPGTATQQRLARLIELLHGDGDHVAGRPSVRPHR